MKCMQINGVLSGLVDAVNCVDRSLQFSSVRTADLIVVYAVYRDFEFAPLCNTVVTYDIIVHTIAISAFSACTSVQTSRCKQTV